MRCVGVCAFLYQNPVAVPRRFLLLQFARNDLSKIPQMLFGALRVAEQVRFGQSRLPSSRSWRASAFDPFRFCADWADDRVREMRRLRLDPGTSPQSPSIGPIRPQPPMAKSHPRGGARSCPDLPPPDRARARLGGGPRSYLTKPKGRDQREGLARMQMHVRAAPSRLKTAAS